MYAELLRVHLYEHNNAKKQKSLENLNTKQSYFEGEGISPG